MRLIDADIFFDKLGDGFYTQLYGSMNYPYGKISRALNACPTIDPVKHAYWIEENDDEQGVAYHCSCCDEWVFDNKGFRFCPHCGARMDGDDK